jgi:hypothetical protein
MRMKRNVGGGRGEEKKVFVLSFFVFLWLARRFGYGQNRAQSAKSMRAATGVKVFLSSSKANETLDPVNSWNYIFLMHSFHPVAQFQLQRTFRLSRQIYCLRNLFILVCNQSRTVRFRVSRRRHTKSVITQVKLFSFFALGTGPSEDKLEREYSQL